MFKAVFVVCLITATTSVHLMLKPTRIRRTAPTRAATGRFTNFKLLCNPTYNNSNNKNSGSFFSGSSTRTKLAAAALVSCGQPRQRRQLNLSKFKSPDRSCLTIDATEGPGVGFASLVSAVADFKLWFETSGTISIDWFCDDATMHQRQLGWSSRSLPPRLFQFKIVTIT